MIFSPFSLFYRNIIVVAMPKTHLKCVFPVDKTGWREYFLINLNYGILYLQFRRIPC